MIDNNGENLEGDVTKHSKQYKEVIEENKKLTAENSLLLFKMRLMMDMVFYQLNL